MGIVVSWPRDHARASRASRAASAVNVSAVTPLDRAISVSKTADQRSAGMLSRCHHFETNDDLTARSDAIASREGQSSITFWNEDKSAIPIVLGQIVLERKDFVSLDGKMSLGHTVPMAESDLEAEYKQGFIARIREARVDTGLKQWQIAQSLGIPQDHYKHYEVTGKKGRLMPHHLIAPFCLICRVNLDWLVTGTGKKAWQPLKVTTSEPETVAKPKKARARKAA